MFIFIYSFGVAAGGGYPYSWIVSYELNLWIPTCISYSRKFTILNFSYMQILYQVGIMSSLHMNLYGLLELAKWPLPSRLRKCMQLFVIGLVRMSLQKLLRKRELSMEVLLSNYLLSRWF